MTDLRPVFFAVGQSGAGCILTVLLLRKGAWYYNSITEWGSHFMRSPSLKEIQHDVRVTPIGGNVTQYIDALQKRYVNIIYRYNMQSVIDVEVQKRMSNRRPTKKKNEDVLKQDDKPMSTSVLPEIAHRLTEDNEPDSVVLVNQPTVYSVPQLSTDAECATDDVTDDTPVLPVLTEIAIAHRLVEHNEPDSIVLVNQPTVYAIPPQLSTDAECATEKNNDTEDHMSHKSIDGGGIEESSKGHEELSALVSLYPSVKLLAFGVVGYWSGKRYGGSAAAWKVAGVVVSAYAVFIGIELLGARVLTRWKHKKAST